MSVFDTDCLKGIERLEIEGDCFMKVNRFVIDELSILKSMIIGQESFKLCESFELKNLPSLISIQLDDEAFYWCHSVVFESMNNWMTDEWDLNQLQSIILGNIALACDYNTTESNELIMKSKNNSDDWLMRSSFSINDQWRFLAYRQSDIEEW